MDLVFHPFVWSHQGAILLKALGGDISVLWTHFFSSFFFFFFFFFYLIYFVSNLRNLCFSIKETEQK